jgi:iron complex outermembrane recepter protein
MDKISGAGNFLKKLTIYFLLFTLLLFIIHYSLFINAVYGQVTDTNKFETQKLDTNEYKTQTIEVDALREIEKMLPVTYENIKRETIEKKYWMQDLPMFLSGNTNINSYSESGSSFGYSYFTIRGFDQRRISVLLNGTPQNDAEDHQVYWVELSDIISSVESIQMQRGIGTVLYGTSGVGGIINVQTIDYFKNKFINVNAGFGDFNSSRYSVEVSSGLTNKGFGFYGKFSKTKTDGYRNLAWSDHYSYFLSAGKMLNDKSSLKLNVYSSPNKNHLAYNGITKDYLDGKVTGSRSADRRYNPLYYPNETDNYNQPHYELIYNYQATKNLFVSSTLNYVRKDGNITANYPISKGYDLNYFRLQPFFVADTISYNTNCYHRNSSNRIDSLGGKGYKIIRSDMVVKLSENSDDYGWYPKIQWKHFDDKANLLAGGELRLHNSEHYGEILYGSALPTGTPSDYKYYFYNGKKTSATFYINEFTNVDKKLSIMIGVQFTYHKYTIDNDAYRNYDFSADYKFLTSRVGFNYNFNDKFKIYSSVCIARREPRLRDIYDADSPNSRPNLKTVDTVNHIYSDPLITYEELTDYEFGVGYNTNSLKANVNFYLMDYKNEIVGNGQVDNIGEPIYWNAGRTIHRGVEFEFEYGLLTSICKKIKNKNTNITLNANLSLSDNYFVDYTETKGVDTLGGIIYGNNYSGNKILLTPQVIGNLSLNLYTDFGLGVFVAMQYIGRQYLDNSENERKNPSNRMVEGYADKVISPFAVFNAGVSLDLIPMINSKNLNKYFRTLEASFKINNMFDRVYETYGGVDNNGVPSWIPAANMNVFFNFRMGF